MQRDEVRAALDAVRKIQKSTDDAADALNRRFLALEKALREASVRIPSSILIAGHPDADNTGWFLSWGKSKNRWCLTIEEVRHWTDDDHRHVAESIPITDAELRLRKLAAPRCAELVLALGDVATKHALELQGATRVMDELLDALGVDPKSLPAEPAADWDDDDIPF